MKYVKMICLGFWLLIIIWFEDTSDWSHEKLLLARRSFAVLILFIVLTSLFFSMKAFSSDLDVMEKRVDRIEVRQDRVYEELSNIKQRLAQVELTSRDSASHIEKMVYGVVGLTFAVLGQLALGLFKYKMGND